VTLTILKRPEPWDAIVVGSGATGGWAALELSRRGLSVLVLEAGGDHGDAPSHPNEPLLRGKRRFDRLLGRRKVQSRHSAYWELDPDLFVVDGEHPYRTAPSRATPPGGVSRLESEDRSSRAIFGLESADHLEVSHPADSSPAIASK